MKQSKVISLPITLSLRLALPLAGTMLLVGGCDQRTPAAKAVEQGSRQLEALNAGGSTAAPESTRQKTYNEVVALAGGTKSGTPGEQAASKLLVASAQRGLSQIPADAAVAADGKVRAMITLTQVSLSNWSSTNASADAAAAFDVSKQLAEIAASKVEREKEIAASTQRQGELQKQIADLRSLAKAKLEQADAKQADYVKQMGTTQQLTAVQATPIVEAANVSKREGDQFRLAGLKIAAEADQIEPLLAEAKAQVEKGTKQRQDLGEIEKSLNERQASAQQEVAARRADAQKAAGEIDKGVADIDALFAGEIASEYGKALDALRKGLAASKDAKADGGTSASMSIGVAQLDLAETTWARAQATLSYASLLESLVQATHPLPNASAFTTKLEAVTKEYADLMTQTSDSFEAAKAAIQGVRVQDKGVTERLEKLKGLLESASKFLKGEEKDLAAAFQIQTRSAAPIAANPAGEIAPAAPGDETGAIRAALGRFIAASKANDSRAMVGVIDLESPAAAQDPIAAATRASIKAETACRAKFQKSQEDVIKLIPLFGPLISQQTAQLAAVYNAVDPSKAEIQIAGNTARITGGGLPFPIPMVQVNGKWLVNPGALAGGASAGPAVQLYTKLAAITDAWADDINAGKFADADAAAADLGPKLQALFTSIGGGTPPPGGG